MGQYNDKLYCYLVVINTWDIGTWIRWIKFNPMRTPELELQKDKAHDNLTR